MDTETLAKMLMIADIYGIDADNDEQRRHRERLYDEGHPIFPEESKVYQDDRSFVRGKDHWLMLAGLAIRALGH